MLRSDPIPAFHFDGDLVIPQNKIDFELRRRAPIGNGIIGSRIVAVRHKLLENKMFERFSESLALSGDYTAIEQVIGNSDIKVIKTRSEDHAAFWSLLKRR